MIKELYKCATQDLATNVAVTEADRPTTAHWQAVLRTCLTARYLSVFLFRVAQFVGQRTSLVAGLIKQLNQFLTGADVAWQAQIGPNLVLPHPVGVVVGPYCVVGSGCILQQGVTLGGNGNPGEGAASSPTLGSGVAVGAGARVLGALTVGDNVRIGANAVVTTSMPSDVLVVGVPARAKRPEGVRDSTPSSHLPAGRA